MAREFSAWGRIVLRLFITCELLSLHVIAVQPHVEPYREDETSRAPWSLLDSPSSPSDVPSPTTSLSIYAQRNGLHFLLPITYNEQLYPSILDLASREVMLYGSKNGSCSSGESLCSLALENYPEKNTSFTLVFDDQCTLSLDNTRGSAIIPIPTNFSLPYTRIGPGLAQPQKLDTLGNVTVLEGTDLTCANPSPIHTKFNVSGIVGMMWNSSYIRMLSSLSPSTLISLGLDFRNIPVNESGSVVPTPTPGSEFYVDTGSKLYFGGGPPHLTRALHWANDTTQSDFTVKLYAPSLCNVTITPDNATSTPATALLDTTASCLSLTTPYFSKLIAWLPLRCDAVASKATVRSCTLPAGQTRTLPTLSFALTDEANAPQIHLPLSSLLLPDSDRICLVESPYSASSYQIVFGARALASMYVQIQQVNGTHARTGLANKVATSASNAQCAAVKQCTGMQVQLPSLNDCIDPKCDKYFLMDLDPLTRTCVMNQAFYIISGVLLFLALVGEAVLALCMTRLFVRVKRTAPQYVPYRDRIVVLGA